MTLTVRNRLLYSCIVLTAFVCLTLVGCSGGGGGPTIKKASDGGSDDESASPGAKTGGMPPMPGSMPGAMPGSMPGAMPGGMPGAMPGMGSATAAAPVVTASLPARSTIKFKEMLAGKSMKSLIVNGKTVYQFVFKDFYKQPWKCELPADVAASSQPKEVWTNIFIAYKRAIVDPNKRKSVVVNRRVAGFPFISPPPERSANAAVTGTGMPGMGSGMPGMPGMGGGMPGMPGMGGGMKPPAMGGAGGGLPGMPGMMPPR